VAEQAERYVKLALPGRAAGGARGARVAREGLGDETGDETRRDETRRDEEGEKGEEGEEEEIEGSTFLHSASASEGSSPYSTGSGAIESSSLPIP